MNERTFLYGGVGAGIARSDFGSIDYRYHEYAPDELHSGRINFKAKWRFLGQAFGGFGWYLNDNWSFTDCGIWRVTVVRRGRLRTIALSGIGKRNRI